MQPHQKYYIMHAVWRTWFFIAYSDERWSYNQFSLPFNFKGSRECIFELESERVTYCLGCTSSTSVDLYTSMEYFKYLWWYAVIDKRLERGIVVDFWHILPHVSEHFTGSHISKLGLAQCRVGLYELLVVSSEDAARFVRVGSLEGPAVGNQPQLTDEVTWDSEGAVLITIWGSYYRSLFVPCSTTVERGILSTYSISSWVVSILQPPSPV